MSVQPEPPTSPLEADRAFCRAVLPAVSRTFALSIEALPPGLREPVRVAYLLCRVVDTVEDSRMESGRRETLFDAFDAALEGGSLAELAGRCAGVGDSPGDRLLCSRVGAVFRVFRALPPATREAIAPHVAEMSRGMRAYARRAEREGGLRIRDTGDLLAYCYYVAGTVGELLTELFTAAVPGLDAATTAALGERAVDFGTGLQLVNVLKDVAVDHARGAVFLPADRLAARGVSVEELLDPEQRPAVRAVLAELVELARERLERAAAYTALWPASSTAGREVRRFCAAPLLLAWDSLELLERETEHPRPGHVPKVPRSAVAAAVRAAERVARGEAPRPASLRPSTRGSAP